MDNKTKSKTLKRKKREHIKFSVDFCKKKNKHVIPEEKNQETALFLRHNENLASLSFIEFESTEAYYKLVKERGRYIGPFNYEYLSEVQSIIETNQMNKLLNITVQSNKLTKYNFTLYEKATKILYEDVDEFKYSKKSIQDYNSMPQFETIENLGSGVFGSVYLIAKFNQKEKFYNDIDENLLNGKNYFYCLKHFRYPDERSMNFNIIRDKIVESIRKEKDIGSMLCHPNIAKVFGCYKEVNFAVLISEYICNGNIRSVLYFNLYEENKHLYAKRLKFYSAQMLMALEYIAMFNIFHGDLKEDNICIDHKGYLKLIDFGYARFYSQGGDNTSGLRKYLLSYVVFHNYSTKEFDDVDTPKGVYKFDLFGIYLLYCVFCIKRLNELEEHYLNIKFEDENEVYFAYTLLGQYGRIPHASELIRHKYYKDINIAKLFFRKYNLISELEIDGSELFKKYNKLNRWDYTYRKLIFGDETKYTHIRKLNPNFNLPASELFAKLK